jgi:hypothetical protein
MVVVDLENISPVNIFFKGDREYREIDRVRYRGGLVTLEHETHEEESNEEDEEDGVLRRFRELFSAVVFSITSICIISSELIQPFAPQISVVSLSIASPLG